MMRKTPKMRVYLPVKSLEGKSHVELYNQNVPRSQG